MGQKARATTRQTCASSASSSDHGLPDSVKTSPKPDTREPSVFPIMVQMKLCRPAHFKRKVLFPTGAHCGYAVRYTNSVKENR